MIRLRFYMIVNEDDLLTLVRWARSYLVGYSQDRLFRAFFPELFFSLLLLLIFGLLRLRCLLTEGFNSSVILVELEASIAAIQCFL